MRGPRGHKVTLQELRSRLPDTSYQPGLVIIEEGFTSKAD